MSCLTNKDTDTVTKHLHVKDFKEPAVTALPSSGQLRGPAHLWAANRRMRPFPGETDALTLQEKTPAWNTRSARKPHW